MFKRLFLLAVITLLSLPYVKAQEDIQVENVEADFWSNQSAGGYTLIGKYLVQLPIE
jgi:hypothetical protein